MSLFFWWCLFLSTCAQEWGRSSLAILDLRDETRQLSSDMRQLLGRDSSDVRSEESAVTHHKSFFRLLETMEHKVGEWGGMGCREEGRVLERCQCS